MKIVTADWPLINKLIDLALVKLTFCPFPPVCPLWPIVPWDNQLKWLNNAKTSLLCCFTQKHRVWPDNSRSVVSENLSYFPQQPSAASFTPPRALPIPTFVSTPLMKAVVFVAGWGGLSLARALEDDVCYSLQHLVTVRPLCRSQGRWAAAEDVQQPSSPEALRAWTWLSLAPEEQTGQAVAEAVNYFKKILSRLHWNVRLPSVSLALLYISSTWLYSTLHFPFDVCFIFGVPVYSLLLLTTNMYSLLLSLISSLLTLGG